MVQKKRTSCKGTVFCRQGDVVSLTQRRGASLRSCLAPQYVDCNNSSYLNTASCLLTSEHFKNGLVTETGGETQKIDIS